MKRVSCVFWCEGRGWRLTARSVEAPSDGSGLRPHRDGYGANVEKGVKQERGGGAQEPHHCLQVRFSPISMSVSVPIRSVRAAARCVNKRFDSVIRAASVGCGMD